MKIKPSFCQSTILRTIFAGFLLILIPLIFLCALCLGWSIERLQEEMAGSYSSSIRMVADTFSGNLRSLQTSAASYLLDDETIRLSGTSAEKPNLFSFSQFDSHIRLQFSSCFLDADVICAFPTQQLAVSKKNGVEHFSSYPLLEDLEQAGTNQPVWALRPSYRHPERNCLSIMIGYVHPEQTRPVIILEIDENELVGQLSALLEKNAGVQAAFFQDFQGAAAVYDPNGCLSPSVMDTLPGHLGEASDYSVKCQGRQLRMIPVGMEELQCTLGVAFDEQEVLAPVILMRRVLIGLLVLGPLFTVSYLVRSYRRIYVPTQMLVTSMERLALGDLTVRVELPQNGEFGILGDHFNAMAQQLDALLKEKYLAEVKLKNAQVKFLRSQINPHFLYNSLFCLYNMIKSQDLDNAADMAIYLGQYYRIGAHLDSQKLSLAQEVENILPYLKIHQIRMAGNLEFSWEIQPGLEDFEIPSLSLQSLVENAVTHAFNKIQGMARLRLQAVREEGWVVLTVEDNGSGIDPDTRKAILRWESYEEGEVHALQNVYNRLRLLYGDSAGFAIEPVEPSGTRVVLRIPDQKGDGKPHV